MFSWLKRRRDGDARPPIVAAGDAASGKRERSLEELRAEVAAIEADLAEKKIADELALERPSAAYRIVKIELPHGSKALSGYFVQAWALESWGYALSYAPERRAGNFSTLGERWHLEYALKRASVCALGDVYIDWYDIGSANPHPTFEAAEEWLAKWLRPEVEEVFFDADGKRAA